MPKRRFGIELELIDIDHFDVNRILTSFGFSKWRVEDDFSLCGCKNTKKCNNTCLTCEIVSPILSTKDDLKSVRKLTEQLIKHGARVNKTCGLHVHVETKDLTPAQCEQVYFRYSAFESEIDLFHPLNRRKDVNNFCLSIKPITEISINEKIKLLNEKKELEVFDLDKNYKLNLASLEKYGTLEFRHHTGTLNYDEIFHWVYFCQEFIDASITSEGNNDSLFFGINENTKGYFLKKIRE
jgi:hypothetical protein